MVTLAQCLLTQFGQNSEMAKVINEGKDLHRLVAAKVTGKPESEVSSEERSKAKPINFGKPGGMGTPALREYAAESYDVVMSDREVEQLEEAWFDLFPEMTGFLNEDPNFGQDLADILNLTPNAYYKATAKEHHNSWRNDGENPAGWLGGMCLKVLRGQPFTRNGALYGSDAVDFLWERVQSLSSMVDEKWAEAIGAREPSEDLWSAVKEALERRSVFTLTGRLRANATYGARHNTVFQGLAADGAKIALWNLWRNGFRIVNFIHDQVLIEVPVDRATEQLAEQVSQIMVQSMKEVVPDVQVKVDWKYRKRWSKSKEDEVVFDCSQKAA
jgi:DNA polymerase I-like protein with 3'-5' exonuclease and polymerase domains